MATVTLYLADSDASKKFYGRQILNLGDLEFKAEDFLSENGEWANPMYVHELANRILRERLEKAAEMFMAKGYGHFDVWRPEDTELDAPATHTARLVCIEEIGK